MLCVPHIVLVGISFKVGGRYSGYRLDILEGGYLHAQAGKKGSTAVVGGPVGRID